MKRLTKQLLASLLALVLAVGVLPVTAFADNDGSGPRTLYMTSKKGSSSYVSISVDLKKSQSIKKSTIKSSNKKVVEVESLSTYTSTSKNKTEYFNGTKDYTSSNEYKTASISMLAKKAGTAKISYKIGSKSYSTKVTVKKYTNPIKSIVLKGVNGGKNFAGKTKDSNGGDVSLSKTQKDAWLTVKAASGWKISYINISTSGSYETSNNYSFSNYNKGVSSAKVGIEKIAKGGRINVECTNTKDGGSLYVTYTLN